MAKSQLIFSKLKKAQTYDDDKVYLLTINDGDTSCAASLRITQDHTYAIVYHPSSSLRYEDCIFSFGSTNVNKIKAKLTKLFNKVKKKMEIKSKFELETLAIEEAFGVEECLGTG